MLFLLIGTFSGFINRLPKSGRWMEGVKSIFAILLFAFALYFLKDAFPFLRSILVHSPVYFLVAGVLMIAGLALGAIHKTFSDQSRTVRISKGFGVALTTIGLFLGIGSLALGPPNLQEPNWVWDEEEGFRLAKEQGKHIMIDFWADWCIACKELDHKTYSDLEVLTELENFVSIKIDFTDITPKTEALREKYKLVGLPTVLFFDPQGNIRPDKRITGFLTPDEFLEHIKGIAR